MIRRWLLAGRGAAVIFSMVVAACAAPHPSQAQSLGPNLINNPSLETAAGSQPADWSQGRWGTNTATFEYPSGSASQGSRYAKVTLSSRSTGDAKWYFKDVPVENGAAYRFSVDYQSTVSTFITARFAKSDGGFTYIDLATPPASASWKTHTVEFTPPTGSVSVTVFHLINQVGSLSTDNYRLSKITNLPPPPPPDPDNLIPNPSLETAGSGNNPDQWFRGRWGTNVAQFEYPVTGIHGARAAKVTLESRSTGDAKWYFKDIPVTAGRKYTFSNQYRSTVPSFVTAQYRTSGGNLIYRDLISLPPSPDQWQTADHTFEVPAGAVALTIFHLIKDVGSLTVDNYQLVRESLPELNRPMVSFSFDDGWKSIYFNALPILETAGFKSSQYIITGRFNFPAYVTAEQTLDMYNRGHEIGSHTINHLDLAGIPVSQAREEIEQSLADLQDLGIDNIKILAYPFGSYNQTVKNLVRDAGYMGSRSSDGGFNQKGNIDPYALKRMPVDVDITPAQVKAWVDQAIATKTWLILNFHRIDHGGTIYSTTPERLQEIVNYVKSKDIDVVTVREGLERMMAEQ